MSSSALSGLIGLLRRAPGLMLAELPFPKRLLYNRARLYFHSLTQYV